jgi:hypothetical protein
MRRPRPINEVTAYADQFTEFAAQVAGMGLDDEDVLTIGYASDGTLIGSAEGKEPIYVRKDIAAPLGEKQEQSNRGSTGT